MLLSSLFETLPPKEENLYRALPQYTLFQNGRHFSILLFTCKLALVASFKGNILLNFEFKNEATRANLQVNKRTLKWRPLWNKVYFETFYWAAQNLPCTGRDRIFKGLTHASCLITSHKTPALQQTTLGEKLVLVSFQTSRLFYFDHLCNWIWVNKQIKTKLIVSLGTSN